VEEASVDLAVEEPWVVVARVVAAEVARVVAAEVEASVEAAVEAEVEAWVEVEAGSEEVVERAVTPAPLTWMLSALPELPL
jgi:hypothetical protein